MPRASDPQAKVQMGKSYISTCVTVKQKGPKLRHLFALSDGIGCHKPNLCCALLKVFTRLDKPRAHIVESATASAQCGDAVRTCLR